MQLTFSESKSTASKCGWHKGFHSLKEAGVKCRAFLSLVKSVMSLHEAEAQWDAAVCEGPVSKQRSSREHTYSFLGSTAPRTGAGTICASTACGTGSKDGGSGQREK